MDRYAVLVLGMQHGMNVGTETSWIEHNAKVYSFLLHVRQYNIPVIFSALQHIEGFPEFSDTNETTQFNTPAHLTMPTFFPDFVVPTIRFDVFERSVLHPHLQERGIKKLLLCGTDTEGYVTSRWVLERTIVNQCWEAISFDTLADLFLD